MFIYSFRLICAINPYDDGDDEDNDDDTDSSKITQSFRAMIDDRQHGGR